MIWASRRWLRERLSMVRPGRWRGGIRGPRPCRRRRARVRCEPEPTGRPSPWRTSGMVWPNSSRPGLRRARCCLRQMRAGRRSRRGRGPCMRQRGGEHLTRLARAPARRTYGGRPSPASGSTRSGISGSARSPPASPTQPRRARARRRRRWRRSSSSHSVAGSRGARAHRQSRRGGWLGGPREAIGPVAGRGGREVRVEVLLPLSVDLRRRTVAAPTRGTRSPRPAPAGCLQSQPTVPASGSSAGPVSRSWRADGALTTMPREYGCTRGGPAPSSKIEISPFGCTTASCWKAVAVPAPILKLECRPLSSHRTAPLSRAMS